MDARIRSEGLNENNDQPSDKSDGHKSPRRLWNVISCSSIECRELVCMTHDRNPLRINESHDTENDRQWVTKT